MGGQTILLWSAVLCSAALYCIVRGLQDLRQKQYVWGALGITSGLILLLVPIQTHAVTVTLPMATESH